MLIALGVASPAPTRSNRVKILENYPKMYNTHSIYQHLHTPWYHVFQSIVPTGITTDVTRRFQEHSEQTPKCAKYLRGKTPLTLVYSAVMGSRSQAAQLEAAIKKLPKIKKEALTKNACLLTNISKK